MDERPVSYTCMYVCNMPISIPPYATSHFKGGRLEIGGAAPQAARTPTGLRTECVHVYVCLLNVGGTACMVFIAAHLDT